MQELSRINDEAMRVMLDWVQHFIEQRKAALNAGKKGVASGELLRSFEIEATKLAQEEGIALLIAFNESGRLIDMKPKNLHYDAWGRNGISRLEAWVQKRGVGNFMTGYIKKHPNYGARKGVNLQRIINDIAWGIAISRTSGKFRRVKSFWNAPKTAGIYDLINKVATQLPSVTSSTIAQQFKK